MLGIAAPLQEAFLLRQRTGLHRWSAGERLYWGSAKHEGHREPGRACVGCAGDTQSPRYTWHSQLMAAHIAKKGHKVKKSHYPCSTLWVGCHGKAGWQAWPARSERLEQVRHCHTRKLFWVYSPGCVMGILNPVIPETLLNLVCLGLFVQKDIKR